MVTSTLNECSSSSKHIQKGVDTVGLYMISVNVVCAVVKKGVSTKIFTGPDYSVITVAMVHVYLQRCAYSLANKDAQVMLYRSLKHSMSHFTWV